MENNIRLSNLPLSLKILVTCFVCTLLLGYGVALLQVYDRTHFDVARILLYYRGAETGEGSGIILPPSFSTLLAATHAHTLSQPVMYLALGLIFVFSHVSEKKKASLVLILFIGSVLSNSAPWLIRYVSAKTIFILHLSQGLMMASFLTMSFVILRDVWWCGKTSNSRRAQRDSC